MLSAVEEANPGKVWGPVIGVSFCNWGTMKSQAAYKYLVSVGVFRVNAAHLFYLSATNKIGLTVTRYSFRLDYIYSGQLRCDFTLGAVHPTQFPLVRFCPCLFKYQRFKPCPLPATGNGVLQGSKRSWDVIFSSGLHTFRVIERQETFLCFCLSSAVGLISPLQTILKTMSARCRTASNWCTRLKL